MSESEMHYQKSNMSSGVPTPGEGGEPIGGTEDTWAYPSFAKEGLVNVELPIRPGREPFGVDRQINGRTEEMQARDVPNHILERTEAAFRTSSAEAIETLAWYSGAVRGAELMDGSSIAKLEGLSRRFAAASDPRKFFTTEIQPFLRGFATQRRG